MRKVRLSKAVNCDVCWKRILPNRTAIENGDSIVCVGCKVEHLESEVTQ